MYYHFENFYKIDATESVTRSFILKKMLTMVDGGDNITDQSLLFRKNLFIICANQQIFFW